MDTLEFQRRLIKQFCPVRLGVPDGCLQLGWEWAAWSGGGGGIWRFGYSPKLGGRGQKIRREAGEGSLWNISEGPGKALEKRLIPALVAADARTFGADHSVVGINDLFVLCRAVLCCALA